MASRLVRSPPDRVGSSPCWRQKPEMSTGLMGLLSRMQTLPNLFTYCTVNTCSNHRNTYAESSRRVCTVCLELDIQVISSGINNFRMDCTAVWSKKGRWFRISIIKRKVTVWTTRNWRVLTSLQLKVIEYSLNYITSKGKVEFVFNFNPLVAFRVVLVIRGIVKAFNGSVVRCWCSDLHRIIPSETIY